MLFSPMLPVRFHPPVTFIRSLSDFPEPSVSPPGSAPVMLRLNAPGYRSLFSCVIFYASDKKAAFRSCVSFSFPPFMWKNDPDGLHTGNCRKKAAVRIPRHGRTTVFKAAGFQETGSGEEIQCFIHQVRHGRMRMIRPYGNQRKRYGTYLPKAERRFAADTKKRRSWC